MIIKAVWEMDVDVSDISPEHVNIEELAKDLAKREIANLISKHDLSADDFMYMKGEL